MQDLQEFDLLNLAVGLALLVWLAVTVLMPWYVYQAAQYARQTRDEVAKTRDVLRLRLDAIQNELRRQN